MLSVAFDIKYESAMISSLYSIDFCVKALPVTMAMTLAFAFQTADSLHFFFEARSSLTIDEKVESMIHILERIENDVEEMVKIIIKTIQIVPRVYAFNQHKNSQWEVCD